MKHRHVFVSALALLAACKDTPTDPARTTAVLAKPVPTNLSATVYTSDASVTAYGPIYQNQGASWATTACVLNPAVTLSDPRWGVGHAATDLGPSAHPWQPGAANAGFVADWINAWPNILSSTGPGWNAVGNPDAHNWTRYERQVSGNGSFQLELLADNCSWIYLDGHLVGFQGASWNYNSLKYGVTLSGNHTLSFLIFDGGGAAGGMFRLETTSNPPPPLTNDPNNLIYNGSFERPIIGATWAPNASVTPWLTFGGPNQGILGWNVETNSVDVQSGEGAFQFAGVPDGVQVLDMNDATISQSVSTNANYRYNVSFALSENYVCMAGGTAGVRVSFGGSTMNYTFTPGPAESAQHMRWDSQSFQAVTSGPASTLRFTSTAFSGCGGPMLDNVKITAIGPVDVTPPLIVPALTGSLNNGWYTSDVGVSWSVTDPESAIVSSTGCAAASVTQDTQGVTFTCSATSAGGTASKSVTVKRDATRPVIAFSGNAGAYTVDQQVAIACAATDAMSGIASSSCPSANAPAYTFRLGTDTLAATATDNAGNGATGMTSFTVSVTPTSLCALVKRFVSKDGVAKSLCEQLKEGEDYKDFREHVSAQSGKSITPTNAALLIALSRQLPVRTEKEGTGDDGKGTDKSSGKDG